MYGKFAFYREYPTRQWIAALEALRAQATGLLPHLKEQGLICHRVYADLVEEHCYAFQFFAVDPEATAAELFAAAGSLLEGWNEARHVYEFKYDAKPVQEEFQTQGIIIGVQEGKLDEYIRLHDEQPQIIRDLLYENGFRKSSIFVADLHKQYLLQFQDFGGQENPELYENAIYQHWLDVTGACQAPLPGEKFWKPMLTVHQ